MLVRTNDGRTKDVQITEVTAENYIVPETAKHVYHCIIEVRKFNPETGERLSRPRLQTFGRKAFESSVYESLRRQGYTITILHNPNEYIAEQQAKAEEARTKTFEEQQAKAAEARKQEIDAEVTKALEEQQAKHEAELEELRRQLAEATQAKRPGRPSKAERATESDDNAESGTNTQE